MEEFLTSRRYCRFNKRKIKQRSNMNDDDDEVNFKLRRFIQDVDKYIEKNKKKKARKEAKIKKNCYPSLGNKGIYKNAVLSHLGIKALCTGSTSARLKGDLISLSKKNKSTENESIINLSEEELNNPREVCTTTNIRNDNNLDNDKSPNSPLLMENKVYNDCIVELDSLLLENNNLEEKIETIPNESHITSNKRQEMQEKNQTCGFFSEVIHSNREEDMIPVNVSEKNLSQNENCKQNFEDETSNEMNEFFDLLHKTPEKRRKHSIKFNLFNNSEITDHQTEYINSCNYQHKFEIGSPDHFQTSKHMPSLTKDYTFNDHSQYNDFFNHKNLFRENTTNNICKNNKVYGIEVLTPPIEKICPRKFNYIHKKSFTSNYNNMSPIIPNDNDILVNSLQDSYFKNISKCNITEKFTNSNPKESFITNMNQSCKKHFPYFEKLKFKDNESKFNLHDRLPKVHLDKRKAMRFKNELLFKQKQSVLRSNIRFKNTLKFSPHKYC